MVDRDLDDLFLKSCECLVAFAVEKRHVNSKEPKHAVSHVFYPRRLSLRYPRHLGTNGGFTDVEPPRYYIDWDAGNFRNFSYEATNSFVRCSFLEKPTDGLPVLAVEAKHRRGQELLEGPNLARTIDLYGMRSLGKRGARRLSARRRGIQDRLWTARTT